MDPERIFTDVREYWPIHPVPPQHTTPADHQPIEGERSSESASERRNADNMDRTFNEIQNVLKDRKG